MNCRFCKTPLEHVFIDLINSPPSNSFLTSQDLNVPEIYFPLKVFTCHKCFLVQIDEYKKSENIFNSDYVYFSSYSKSWLKHAETYAAKMTANLGLNSDSHVVEIASNDGYLLQYFLQAGIPVLGIEPTSNTAEVAINKGIKTVVDFFGVRLAKELSEHGMGADLLVGNNVLAHVPDILDFVGGMKILLNDTGVITMEFPHLMRLIENNQFDTIYHEHYSYLSLTSVRAIFESQALDIFDVEELPTHGGSLRVYAKHKTDTSREIAESVSILLETEKLRGMLDLNYYESFKHSARQIKSQLLNFLLEADRAGKSVAAYGAAAKGNTLLNYCGIKNDIIRFVVDANPNKQNKYLPGSHIPVVEEFALKQSRPDYLLLLPWNLKDELLGQLRYVRDWGGQFVIPIPALEIL